VDSDHFNGRTTLVVFVRVFLSVAEEYLGSISLPHCHFCGAAPFGQVHFTPLLRHQRPVTAVAQAIGLIPITDNF
jgi:hypothetical protein